MVSPVIVAFYVRGGGDSVEATDGEDHLIDDLDGEVTALVVHVGDGRPQARGGLEHLPRRHPRYAVETTYYVNLKNEQPARKTIKFAGLETGLIIFKQCD